MTGRSLRTRSDSVFDPNSIYGRAYNCVKCGMSVELLEVLDINDFDNNLKICLEALIDADYEHGVPLMNYIETE